jgi:hypothetical protein
MCGKPGWIYDVNPAGNIISKKLHEVPENLDKYKSSKVIQQIKEKYLEIVNL